MSLQFVTGNSGSGKSHTVFQRIIREAGEHPERSYLVVVPEQFTLQTQKDLVGLHPKGGLLNIDILSFNRLAYRIFEETGGDRLPVLDELGKTLVVQKAIASCRKGLRLLGGTLERQGAAAKMKSLISELLQYRVGPQDLENWLSDGEKRRQLGLKIADVQLIYREFHAYLENKYRTTEEMPEVLCRVIDRSEKIRSSTIVFDGFTGFTPVQYQVVRKLLALCRKVIVVVTLDEREDPFRHDGTHRLFYMSKQMVRKLSELAAECGVETEPPALVAASDKSRFAENPPLAFLEKNLFRYGAAVYDGPQQAVQLFEAQDPAEETDAVAARIRYLIREKGYRYRDFAVVTGDPETYGALTADTFSRENIPFFLDQKLSVLSDPAVEFVRAALEMCTQNFSYESVFRFLRSGMTDFTNAEIDELENYVLALGIRGRKKYGENWVRRPKYMKEQDTGRINALRSRFAEKTVPFAQELAKPQGTVRHKTEVLYRFIAEHHLQEKLKTAELSFRNAGDPLREKESRQIYPMLMQLLDRVVEVLGSEKMKLADYRQILEAGLAESRIGLIPPGEDQVLIGDIERSRLKEIKVLFLVGVNDTSIPKAVSGKGILSEADREELMRRHVELAPLSREEMYQQRFYLYLNMTKPSDLLFLSYSRTDSAGNACMPSYLLTVLRQMFPHAEMRKCGERSLAEMLETGHGERKLLLSGMQKIREEAPSPAFMEVFSLWKKTPENRVRLKKLFRAAASYAPEGGIGMALARAVYGNELANSATRLERFAACAYAHFLKYGLQLNERELYLFSPADMGNVMHEALQRFSVKLKSLRLQWGDLDEERRTILADEALEEIVHDYGNTILHSSSRNAHMIRRIRKILRRTVWALQEQVRRGSFRPAEFERNFLQDLPSTSYLLDEGTRLFLKGRIDRIDICREDDTEYVKVIDYKTGSAKFSLQDLYSGLQLQLMVYLSAAVEERRKRSPALKVEPAGMFYYKIEDPFAESRESEDALLEKLIPDGICRSEEHILRLYDHTLEPQERSLVLPLRMNKDGSFGASSRTVPGEIFSLLRVFTSRKITEIGNRIMAGETKAHPYRKSDKKACGSCPYKTVCGFDERIPGNEYRWIRKEKTDDLLKKMREVL